MKFDIYKNQKKKTTTKMFFKQNKKSVVYTLLNVNM